MIPYFIIIMIEVLNENGCVAVAGIKGFGRSMFNTINVNPQL